MNTEHFDKAAATWDDNPVRSAMSAAVAAAIAEEVPLHAEWRALECGCGTAALSFLLHGRLGSITAADASGGMIELVRRKMAACGVRNITPVQVDLTKDVPVGAPFDFIFSAMVLHHVVDIPGLASRLVSLLAPGGWLALADLCLEDGTFHPDTIVPHNGFDPDTLAAVFRAAGLASPSWRVVHEMERNGRRYPLFLLTGAR